MNSLPEIQTAIRHLSEIEVRQLSNWLQEYLEEAWDKQIEADAKSGRLDKLIQQANQDIDANRVKSLDEIIHNS
ncbi:hypothetical protein PI95_022755 [Hassallia byssoidea VB512170]|uniref:Uncharacterized protein n=1 Tax=Hassallia byssoidea VB512170 TaxID=1304833 RepID=A0A846HE96_9CYAN|nr:hypothetical protein [Hassalia byssoidea]NEU75298.1 hypothetical protein [Hassalia byssoidea VB512170]